VYVLETPVTTRSKRGHLMPRKRPRVGQSTAAADRWRDTTPPTTPPSDNFQLEYRDNLPGYVVVGTNVPLADLLDMEGNFTAHGWAGLAAPDRITVTKRFNNPQQPADFECSYSHSHRRWEGIDEHTGEPEGNRNDSHTHQFGLEEFVTAQYDQNDPSKVMWYPRHLH
jgi:hypothetical protein